MSSYEDMNNLYSIVGIKRLPEDDIVPDSVPHLVYLKKEIDKDHNANGTVIIPVFCTGSQWDLMWWIYRLREPDTTFDVFLADFLGEIYESYYKR